LRFLTSYAGQRLFCPTYFEELSESRSDGLAKHNLSDVFRSGSKKNTPNMNVLLLHKHTPKKSLSEVLLFSG
jgi:hypothetical protein